MNGSPVFLQIVMTAAEAAELEWQDQALCAETDPEAFFPEKGGSTRDAKRVCRVCPVRAECLQYALDHDERFGIWGGMSERERRRLKREAPKRAIAAADAAWDSFIAGHADRARQMGRENTEAYRAAKAARSQPVPQPRESAA